MYKTIFFLLLIIWGCNRSPREVRVIKSNKDSPQDTEDTITAKYRPLKVAVSAILSPRETFESYEEMFKYISKKVNRPIEFHQRRTYQEINELLESGKLDFAFICTGAYVDLDLEKGVELFTIPISNDTKFYKAYIITKTSFNAAKLEDLRNAKFAFTDPMSNSGYLYVKHRLAEIDEIPETFFHSTVFTYGHDISVQMVAKGIVEAASVSHLVYEYLKAKEPDRVENIKIIEMSEEFGMPPVVVSSRMDSQLRKEIYDIFTTLHLDDDAKPFLDALLINRFIEPIDKDYNSVREMHKELEQSSKN